jgi:hypothetical protein
MVLNDFTPFRLTVNYMYYKCFLLHCGLIFLRISPESKISKPKLPFFAEVEGGKRKIHQIVRGRKGEPGPPGPPGNSQEALRAIQVRGSKMIFKRLWSPRIDSKASFPPAYVAWRAGTITLFLLGASPP